MPQAPQSQSALIELTVAFEDAGARLDRWLADRVPDLSRARLQALVREGAVLCGRETIGETKRPVKSGEVYTVRVPPPVATDVVGEDLPLTVAYEDADVIVIDKPAGLVVHPAAGHASGTLVNALIAHCGPSLSGIGGVMRPGIVHRLDKDTTGLLVIAKTDLAHQSLSEQFKSHGEDGRLSRIYLALIWGIPVRNAGTIDAPLARSVKNRTKIAVVRAESGRHAVTHYRVLKTFHGATRKGIASLVELRLETGRTHQIRVHMAHIGHPVLGDPIYGSSAQTKIMLLSKKGAEALRALGRQALHAAELTFEHPRKHRPVVLKSKIPNDIQSVIDALG